MAELVQRITIRRDGKPKWINCGVCNSALMEPKSVCVQACDDDFNHRIDLRGGDVGTPLRVERGAAKVIVTVCCLRCDAHWRIAIHGGAGGLSMSFEPINSEPWA